MAPRVVLGVTGSIAAYKAAEVARRLGDAGVAVQVAMTHGAARFVTPLTFEALTGRPVLDDPWARGQGEIHHVERAHEIDLLLVAPATAHCLARLAAGFADDPLCAIALSTTAPVLLAPAMEHGMWHHPATQANLRTLVERGVSVVGPRAGALASGRSGDGRMAEPAEVVAAALAQLGPHAADRRAATPELSDACRLAPGSLAGRAVVVTAGPTWEPIDPVRVLSNRSTGAMGVAVAEAALYRGARVRLILGPGAVEPRQHPLLDLVRVETAQEMLAAAAETIERADAFIAAAAVSDYRVAEPAPSKRKRGSPGAKELVLEENPDILKTLAPRVPGVVVGFAAETEDVEAHARSKLEAKGCHLVIANEVGADRGFGPGHTSVLAVGRDRPAERFGPASKADVARFLWDRVEELLEVRR